MIRQKGMLFRDSVCLFKTTKTVSSFGKEVEGEPEFVCEQLADVQRVRGFREMKFNEIGVFNPVSVRMRSPNRKFDFLMWKGRRINLTEPAEDNENRGEMLFLYGTLQ